MIDNIARMTEILSKNKDCYDAAAKRQCAVFNGETMPVAPLLLSANLTPEQALFPAYTTKQTHFDSDKMLVDGLRVAFTSANGGMEAVPSVRANMGCGIVASLLGVLPELFDDKMPWVQKHLTRDDIRDIKASDIKITPEFRQALDHMEYMAKRLEGSGVRVYPVDIQGAFDTAHLVIGDDIFYLMYDEPELLHHLLDITCVATELAFDECMKRMPGSDEVIPHYNALAMPRSLGGLKLSEDTSTLLNRAQIDEFVMPYMHRLLAYAGGGYIHYCGRNPHLYAAVLAEPLVHALNFGNPEKHDMEQVISDLASAGKLYYGYAAPSKDETRADYFARVTRAAVKDYQIRLLLQYSCGFDERDAVRADWERACSAALKG